MALSFERKVELLKQVLIASVFESVNVDLGARLILREADAITTIKAALQALRDQQQATLMGMDAATSVTKARLTIDIADLDAFIGAV